MKKKVMVAGLGKSGISAAKLLLDVGSEVFLYDGNAQLDVENIIEKLHVEDRSKITTKTGELLAEDLAGIHLCAISPGIDLETPFVKVINEAKVPIWSEIELGYAIAKGELIAITGTNGKTTTTALTGAIMKKFNSNSFTVGNIGIPYTDVALATTEKSITVLEASSFQLETIIKFRPHVSAILNITPDHLNRHHTMENYARIKEDITLNQSKDDFCILNYEDEVLRKFGTDGECPATVVFFSSAQKLENGFYLDGDMIYHAIDGKSEAILNIQDVNLLGRHNYENIMAAIAMADCMKVPMDVI